MDSYSLFYLQIWTLTQYWIDFSILSIVVKNLWYLYLYRYPGTMLRSYSYYTPSDSLSSATGHPGTVPMVPVPMVGTHTHNYGLVLIPVPISSFRGAKKCKIGKKGCFFFPGHITDFGKDMTDKLKKKCVFRVYFHNWKTRVFWKSFYEDDIQPEIQVGQPRPWSCTPTCTHTHGLEPVPVPVPIPIPMASYTYPYPYPHYMSVKGSQLGAFCPYGYYVLLPWIQTSLSKKPAIVFN